MGDRFDDLPAEFRGTLYRPDDVGFADVVRVFNGRGNDTAPAAIAQCLDQDDVVALVRWSQHHDVPIAVRGGGHGADATAVAGGSLVLDLSLQREVEVDPESRVVRVAPGARLGDLDAATQEHGLVVPSGTNSDTGVAGLALGGGVGHLMRRFGATVDNLLGCDLVTAEGEVVRADADTHPDLFWALRGGGGNFGVVTRFDFRAHALAGPVLSGQIVFPGEQATSVLVGLEEFLRDAPRELSVLATVTPAPDAPFIPDDQRGRTVVVLTVVWSGSPADGNEIVQSLHRLGTSIADLVAERSWVETNSMLDEAVPREKRLAQRGGYLAGLSRETAATLTRRIDDAPQAGLLHTVNVYALGGALSEDVDEDATAFSRAGAHWLWESIALWEDPADDAVHDGWSDALYADLREVSLSNGYVNLTHDLGPEWRRRIYGDEAKWARLVEVKRRWDPTNRFRHTKNIDPVEG